MIRDRPATSQDGPVAGRRRDSTLLRVTLYPTVISLKNYRDVPGRALARVIRGRCSPWRSSRWPFAVLTAGRLLGENTATSRWRCRPDRPVQPQARQLEVFGQPGATATITTRHPTPGPNCVENAPLPWSHNDDDHPWRWLVNVHGSAGHRLGWAAGPPSTGGQERAHGQGATPTFCQWTSPDEPQGTPGPASPPDPAAVHPDRDHLAGAGGLSNALVPPLEEDGSHPQRRNSPRGRVGGDRQPRVERRSASTTPTAWSPIVIEGLSRSVTQAHRYGDALVLPG